MKEEEHSSIHHLSISRDTEEAWEGASGVDFVGPEPLTNGGKKREDQTRNWSNAGGERGRGAVGRVFSRIC